MSVSPSRALHVRAQARALLFTCGVYENLAAAVLPLLAYAHDVGLDAQIGADGVLAIIKDGFGDQWVEAE